MCLGQNKMTIIKRTGCIDGAIMTKQGATYTTCNNQSYY